MRYRVLLWILVPISVCIGAANGADWAQWRGPGRNGIAPPGPALSPMWPAGGPKKLWESEKIPSGEWGGLGSLAVAGGRVYLFVSWRYEVQVPITVCMIPEGHIRSLGWVPERLPVELERAMEEARVSEERAKLKDNEIRPWLDKWLAEHLSEEQKRQFGGFVYERLRRGKDAYPLDLLNRLATIRDKEIGSREELEKWFVANGIDGELKNQVLRGIPTVRTLSRDTVICLDANDGKTLWKDEFPGRYYGWGSSSTPCIVGGRCYVAGGSDLYCLDATTGKEIWKTWLIGREISSSPLVIENLVVILGGWLSAYDANTGRLVWAQQKIQGNNGSPVAWVKDGKTYVLCNTGGETACADLKTGDQLWRVPGGGNCTPALDGDRMVVYAERGDIGLVAYKLSPTGAEKLWSVPPPDRGSSPLIYEGHVYAVGSDRVRCVNIETGKVKWEKVVGGGTEISSPIIADGKILAFYGRGNVLAMLEATPENFSEFARVQIQAAQCSSPAIVDGKLYLRLAQCVASFDLSKEANALPQGPAK